MNKSFIYITAALLVVISFLMNSNISIFDFGRNSAPNASLSNTGVVGTVQAAAGSEEQYQYLSVQRSSSCGLQSATVATYSDDQQIQGSCCSQMDLHRYQEQVEGLKKYSGIDTIPKDPYDISALLAKRLLDYQKNITLTTEQQVIYDEATEIAGEGGPCCCKCWRWHAFEGQAKYLITELGWTAEQVAELWDLEDGCGGTGHSGEGGGH
ncbi:hypothetical protein COU87_03570 [Candidatus Roizmanbacteria bacterium CG10_big_fil_rev_8_21_14_0_10_39_12]|uniref:Uncharacterized protein n=1 Tax=Candidatus Roizmanbacteria bacterium CG10_big_fil_rev_8_21_14_0_10_39_12 TaxID=1974852 RepID=A0A2M8KNZ0_9BACT|nr:MAG: hypothetical protein COU87_03570 [Candidatus Roizmanbacteria bacterium CG10_big_fil_rev_8_21_14_0_10_39_12]